VSDGTDGVNYLNELVSHHISGQLKIAPEHSVEHVLVKMGKPDKGSLLKFRELFYKLTGQAGKKQFLTYYLIAAHPGCTERDMKKLRSFSIRELKLLPEQIQIFTPTPSTYSTLMYWTERDPFTGEPVFVEKKFKGRQKQKSVLKKTYSNKSNPRKINH
jgi:radical SAM superfamily enzyme YgiQ (UPF0313 family)